MASDFSAKKALAKKGHPAIVVKPGQIPKPCSITLVTSLNTAAPVYWTSRYGTNDQSDFVASVRTFVNNGVIRNGDILVMDNASVHVGEQAKSELQIILYTNNISLCLMPTYSPELNPCEFVFARLKRFVQSSRARLYHPETQREVVRNFDDLLSDAADTISMESMYNTYRHCRTLDLNSNIAAELYKQGLLIFNDM